MIRHAARMLFGLGVALGASRLLYGCTLPLGGLGADAPGQDGSGDEPAIDDPADAPPADIGGGDVALADPPDSDIDPAGGGDAPSERGVDARAEVPEASDATHGSDTGKDVHVDAEAARDTGVVDAGAEAETGGIVTPVFVQSDFAVPQSPQDVVTVRYASPQTAGNLNVVVVGWNDSTALVTSLSDTAGNAYELAIGPTVAPGALSQSIYFAGNIASAPDNGVTVQFSAPAPFPDVRVLEYAGIQALGPFEVATGTLGIGALADAGSVVTTSADLLVAATTVSSYTTGAGGGYTARVLTSPNGDLVEDRFARAPGPYGATAPISPAGQWVMQAAAFRAK